MKVTEARLFLTGCALTGLAEQHSIGADHSAEIGVDAVSLADAALKALRIGSTKKVRKVAR